MANNRYNRSELHSYYDLSISQKSRVLEEYHDNDLQSAEEDTYVLFNNHDNEFEVLPLSMFMRLSNSKVWDGVYGLSAFSGFYIKLSKCNTVALISYQTF